MSAGPSPYAAAVEIDATRNDGAAAASRKDPESGAAATTGAASRPDSDGPETCCAGVYENNPTGGFFRIFCEWILIPTLLMFGPAYGIYSGNKDVYNTNIERLYPDSMDGLWVALTLFIFMVTMLWVTVQPVKYKGRVFGWEMADDIWANPMLLRTMPHLVYKPGKRRNLIKMPEQPRLATDLEAQAAPPLLVAMETQGVVGKLNRGTRSLHNMCENAFSIYILAVYLSRIFPLPMFVLSLLWCIGRIGHQYTYAEKGYGPKKHLPYFVLASNVQHVMHCLVLLVALRCAGLL